MQIIKATTAKQILKKHCWLNKDAMPELDKTINEMIQEMGQTLEAYLKTQKRRKATPKDVRYALDKYKQKYVAEDIEKTLDEITSSIIDKVQKKKKEVEAFYGREIQGNLP